MKKSIIFCALMALSSAPYEAHSKESAAPERTAFQRLKTVVTSRGDNSAEYAQLAAPRSKALQKCVNRAGGNNSVENLKTMDDAHKQKIGSLCASGKREIAQEYARDVATEMMRDPRVVKLQQCPNDVLGSDPYLYSLTKSTGVEANQNICDKGE